MKAEIWEARAAKLARYSGAGKTVAEIASESGYSAATVRRYETEFGFDFGGSVGAEGAKRTAHLARIEQIRTHAADGKTREETGRILGLTTQSIGNIARENGISFVHASEGQGVDRDRAEVMASMFRGGKTLAQIGEVYGVSRERVRQIITKIHGLKGGDGGQSVAAAKRRKQAKLEQDRRHFDRFGCTREQHSILIEVGEAMIDDGASFSRTPTGAWTSQRNNSLKRNIEWSLNLWDWWQIWQQSGKWENRGRGKDKYVMCRFKDTGSYEVGNVYIATMSHNAKVQPNNPYRKGHPDHASVIAKLRARIPTDWARVSKKRKYHDLPIGVTKQRGRYIAQISIHGRSIHIGSFSTPEEAGAAYLARLADVASRIAA